MHIQTDRALMPAATPSVRYLQVLVSAPPAPASGSAAASRPPVHVALVLDRSGSMDGSKITMARTAVAHAVRLLKPARPTGPGWTGCSGRRHVSIINLCIHVSRDVYTCRPRDLPCRTRLTP